VETQEEAAAIAERATDANFAQLAGRLSTDPSAQDNAGDLGFLPASSLDPAYVQAALALEPGQIGGPVQSSFGWHVIRLVRVRTQPFAQVRDQLRAELAGQAFRDWIVAAWTDGEIEVNPRYGRFDPDSGLVVGISSNATGTPPAEQASPPP
jgi:parvulin-like peptidyl-prolyl isomerase